MPKRDALVPPPWISGLCMMPTRVLPSGVIASPSMPLLATLPEVLLAISVLPTGLKTLQQKRCSRRAIP
jgi:hypothetical protein